MTGKENFLQLSVMELVSFLIEKRKLERGNSRNKAGEVLKLKLGGKKIFLAGQPFTKAGRRLTGVVTGGVCF